MKKLCKFMGAALLSIVSLIVITGPASYGGVGIERLPESIKEKR